ncbi:MAG: nucleotidyltransferase domain-containing protein [Candidatus Woesearchaeota archaeon]
MKEKILNLFINYPQEDFSARGIARKLNTNHVTILKYLKELKQENLIKTKTTTLYDVYYANTTSNKYIRLKKNYIVEKIISSKLIKFLNENCYPDCIVLFGSCAKGTFNENSDIDIFIESSYKNLNLTKFEKVLNHNINIIFEPKIRNLSGELVNNIINGIILSGYIKVF